MSDDPMAWRERHPTEYEISAHATTHRAGTSASGKRYGLWLMRDVYATNYASSQHGSTKPACGAASAIRRGPDSSRGAR